MNRNFIFCMCVLCVSAVTITHSYSNIRIHTHTFPLSKPLSLSLSWFAVKYSHSLKVFLIHRIFDYARKKKSKKKTIRIDSLQFGIVIENGMVWTRARDNCKIKRQHSKCKTFQNDLLFGCFTTNKHFEYFLVVCFSVCMCACVRAFVFHNVNKPKKKKTIIQNNSVYVLCVCMDVVPKCLNCLRFFVCLVNKTKIL